MNALNEDKQQFEHDFNSLKLKLFESEQEKVLLEA